jgi:radical SAM protein with 4Fe4S-binding SPASM domain
MKWKSLFKSSTGDSELAWIDTFIRRVRPYIFVRVEDNLLIKRPNSAIKLNPMGARIMSALLDGHTIDSVLHKTGRDLQKRRDILNFFLAVKQQLEGKLEEFTQNPAVETETFHMNFTKLPVLSEVALTYRCNLKCRFCYAGCNCTSNPVQSSDEMSVEQIKAVLQTIYRDARVPSVSFTGGEPTLRPELPELIEYAAQLGMRVNLITNGIEITPEKAKTFHAAGLSSAQVSLEGVTAEVHDKVVRRKGAFEKTVAAVTYLKDAGITTHTNTTVTRLNLPECTRFPLFVKERLGNDRFSMNLVIPSGSGSLDDGLQVRYSEVGDVLRELQAVGEALDVEFMWYSPVPMCMFNTVAHGLGNKGCSACDGLLSVAPNGDVLPCSSYADSVGNLLEEQFSDIWENSKATYYRRKEFARDRCKACGNFEICNGACPLYWQHRGYTELETFSERENRGE